MTSFPNLLIIGAMKAGTTSLHDYLGLHPDIFMSEPKELHFYDDLSQLSREKYLNNFNSKCKVIGTTPQNYTKAHHKDFKNIPERIFKDTPNVKLIYIVRDPFERVLSHVVENRYGDSPERSKQNLKTDHYWKTSLYDYQISQYLKFFKKSQIHVLTLEDLKENRLYELNKIFKFIDLKELEDNSQFDYIMNDASSKQVPDFIKSQYWFRILKKLNLKLAEKMASQVVNNFYTSYLSKPKLSEIINREIVEIVRADSSQFQKKFNVDISEWNLNPDLNE